MNNNLKIENPFPGASANYKPYYYFKTWLELEDGGSDRWVYVCRDSLAYIFIVIDDLPAVCGRDADALFIANVSVVDLLTASPKTIGSALDSCGYDEEIDFTKESDRLQIAYMMMTCGSRAPMWREQGGKVKCIHDKPSEMHPAFRTLRANARKYAEENLFFDEKRNDLMNNTVFNAIGQSPAEFANGADGLWSSLRRIKDNDEASPQQKLILKMYQSAKTTIGVGDVPSDLLSQ